MGVLRALPFELTKQLTLALVEFLRRLNRDLNVHVAPRLGAQGRHAFMSQPEAFSSLRSFRHLHIRSSAANRRHFDLAAERCCNHADRHPAVEISAFALE